MRLYQKINTYLLERYPLLWNTQFVWVVLLGLLLHILFFVLGYNHVSYSELTAYGLTKSFVNSIYVWLYLVLALLILIYFGFRYFSHNPFRHFYPIGKNYFTKVLLLLFFIMFTISTVHLSFEDGMRMRANKLVPKESILSDIQKVNEAVPFLFNNMYDYYIINKKYPAPFDSVEELSKRVIGYDTANHIDILRGIDKSLPYVTLQDKDYQFGIIDRFDIDSCRSGDSIRAVIDVSNIPGLASVSFLNYSGLYIASVREFSDSTSRFIPKVQAWYLNKDTIAIAQAITQFKHILSKYKLKDNLDAKLIASKTIKQNLEIKPLIRVAYFDYTADPESPEPTAAAAAAAAATDNLPYFEEIDFNAYCELNSLDELFDNVDELNTSHGWLNILKYSTHWIYIFLCLGLALVLILLKYLEIITLIISVVVSACLSMLIGLVLTAFKFLTIKSDTYFQGITLVLLIIVIGIGLLFLSNTYKNKKWGLWWSIPFAKSLLIVGPLAYVYIREITKIKNFNKCNPMGYDYEYLFDIQPGMILIFSLVSIFIIFTYIKKIHSQAA